MTVDVKLITEKIDTLVADKEWNEVEYKSAKGGFPGTFWSTYSSFANTEGGVIILGVREKDDIFYPDGLSEEAIEKYRKDFWNMANNPNHVNRNILKEDDVIPFQCNGLNFLLFRIPPCHRSQKPIYHGPNPYNGTYKRNYEGDYLCTEEEVKHIFADANIDTASDSRILPNYTFDDIDKVSLEQYRRLFNASKSGHPWVSLDDLELLKKLGGYRKDRATGEEGFTLAGLLMFGKTESITDAACAPFFFPDYRLYPEESLSPSARWVDRICPDGLWEANLFQFYRRVLPKITTVLPKPFRLDEDTRIDETTAHIALREALINLCVHADYSVNASLVVKQYPNRIILSNPGSMLVSRYQYYKGSDSVCRNPSLQKMFSMLGKAEKAGSGVDKILQGWHDENWKQPYLTLLTQPDKVELHLRMEPLMSQEVENALNQIYGSKRIAQIDNNRLIALSLAYTENEVSVERLQYLFDIHRTDIHFMLGQLTQEGMLSKEGYGQRARYHINKGYVNNVTTSNPNITTSNPNITTSDPNITTSDPNITTSEKTRTRIPRNVVVSKILEYCREEFRSLNEIATHLGKNELYIRNNYLKKMLEDGSLQKLYPNIPHHPNQKYKSA